ncbi:MAG: efflux RND transporter periplasmic adaptor subunit [Burkholderiaceae bacterium]
MTPMTPMKPMMPMMPTAMLAALLVAAAPSIASAVTDGAPVRFLLVAGQETVVSAATAGRLARVAVELGDRVKAGQVLAAYDCAEIEARRGAARSELEAARVQYEAKVKLHGLQSVSDVDVELAAANADRAEQQLRVADTQVRQCTFTAPFAGTVARVHVKVGQGLGTGEPLVELVGNGPMKVRMNVPSPWLAWLKTGTTLDGRIDETGADCSLTVTRIAGRVDAVSQTVEIEARLAGGGARALPGMSGLVVAPPVAAAKVAAPASLTRAAAR